MKSKTPLLVCAIVAFAGGLRAASLSVTNLADSGPGSLRQAILDANANPGPDTILFNISGPAPYTIKPTSALPNITDPVTIDGRSQPGFAGKPLIVLDGSMAGPSVNGLTLSSGNSAIQGLAIGGFSGFGLYLQSVGGNVIRGNYIGVASTGATSLANTWGIAVVGAPNNLIGGTNDADRNVISGNLNHGIEMALVGCAGTRVQGNFIGTDAAGNIGLGNGVDGISLHDGVASVTIGGLANTARNIISGNGSQGVEIESGSNGNLVQGNFVGTDVNGTTTLGNIRDGIIIGNSANNRVGGTSQGAGNLVSGNGIQGVEVYGPSATGNLIQGNLIGTDIGGHAALANGQSGVGLLGAANNTVGGTTAAARNIISGNTLNGVVIGTDAFSGAAASGNTVLGNYIGTDITGTKALGNKEDGIFVDAAFSNTIGGVSAGARNIISANGFFGRLNDGSSGIEIWDGATNTIIRGNLIGTDISGTLNLGNKEYGVFLQNSSLNTVGGAARGARNLIAFNHKAGVAVQATTSAQSAKSNLIRANSIFANGGLGIDLGLDGVTPNDAGDGDSGANDLQNYPVLASAVANGNGSTTISGSLNSLANASFTLEFFSNAACDPSGYGEGQTPIGVTNVTTGASGSRTFAVNFTNTVPAGQFITATATDVSANTSEFSACAQVLGQPRFTAPMLISSNLVLAASSGTPGGTYRILSSTNVILPRASWTQIGTGSFDAAGNFSVMLTVNAADAQRFYAVAVP